MEQLSVFTIAASFDHGANRLLEAGPLAQAPEQQRADAAAVVARLREKLGFQTDGNRPRSGEAVIGQVPANTLVHIFRPRYKDYLDA